MAHQSEPKTKFHKRSLESFSPNVRLDTGNPQMGQNGSDVYNLYANTETGDKSIIGMTEGGITHVYGDRTIEIVGGQKNPEGSVDVFITGLHGSIVINALENGDVCIKGRNIHMEAKEDIINRVREAKGTLVKEDTTGDEGDQTNRILQESEFMANQERLRKQLFEIESALSRIDDGTYGLCEETDEPIEEARLKAIPWTRLSIEGAEIRESQQRKYAR